MAFCNQCGKELDEGARFCTACGAPVDGGAKNSSTENTPAPAAMGEKKSENKSTGGSFSKYFAYRDTTASYNKTDVEQNRLVSVLAYLHILVLVPFFGMKESPFAQYHAKLGLNLLIWHLVAQVGGSIITSVLGWIPVIGTLLNLAFGLLNLVLWAVAVFGIVSAAQGKARELIILEPLKFLR